jgi:hypothetical protein
MKTPVLIVLGALVLMAGSGLAIMNNACKSGHHTCAPMSSVPHHVQTGYSEPLHRARFGPQEARGRPISAARPQLTIQCRRGS